MATRTEVEPIRVQVSAPPKEPPRRSDARSSVLLYLVALVLVLGVLEALVRQWTTNRPLHWDAMSRAVEEGPVDVLFLGTSRVAAAIDPMAFAAEVESRFGRPVRVVNLGIGHYTLAMHYLGARNLLEEHPGAFEGTTVFIEAPVGIQEAITWRDRWHIPGSTKLLVPLLTLEDLPRLWRSRMELGEKVYLTVVTITRGSALLTYRERIGSGFLATGTERVMAVASSFDGTEDQEPTVDLAAGGGIQTDPRLIEDIARTAVGGFVAQRELPENQLPIKDWNGRALGDLVRLIEAAGGHVVFFEIPLHSTQATIRSAAVRHADRAEFEAQAAQWGTPVLSVDFSYSDEDFPDVFHLRQSRSAEYTRAVFASWAGETTAVHPSAEAVVAR